MSLYWVINVRLCACVWDYVLIQLFITLLIVVYYSMLRLLIQLPLLYYFVLYLGWLTLPHKTPLPRAGRLKGPWADFVPVLGLAPSVATLLGKRTESSRALYNHKGTKREYIYGSTVPLTSTPDGAWWSTPHRPLFTRIFSCTHCIGSWLGLRPFSTGSKNLAQNGIRYPDRPARSKAIYRLSYPVPQGNGNQELKIFQSSNRKVA